MPNTVKVELPRDVAERRANSGDIGSPHSDSCVIARACSYALANPSPSTDNDPLCDSCAEYVRECSCTPPSPGLLEAAEAVEPAWKQLVHQLAAERTFASFTRTKMEDFRAVVANLAAALSSETREGEVELPDGLESICPACGGAGKQSDHDQGKRTIVHDPVNSLKRHHCFRCNGTGRVPHTSQDDGRAKALQGVPVVDSADDARVAVPKPYTVEPYTFPKNPDKPGWQVKYKGARVGCYGEEKKARKNADIGNEAYFNGLADGAALPVAQESVDCARGGDEPDIHVHCLTNPDGEWMCPDGGAVTKRQMIRQVAELWDVTEDEVAQETGLIYMRPLADTERNGDDITHVRCDPEHPDGEQFWMVSV